MREIVLNGGPFERGFQYGSAVAADIQRFLGEGLARVNWVLPAPVSNDDVFRFVESHRPWIERDHPDLTLELKGLAAGAQIAYHDALFLQLRRELIGTFGAGSGADCTTFAIHGEGGGVMGQTVDQDGLMADLGVVLRIVPQSAHEPEILMFTFAGLLGYLGINSHGLGVCINMLTADYRQGVSPYLLVREALRCGGAAEAAATVARARRASARALTFMDADQIVCCEFTTDRFRSWNTRRFARANHFLHDELSVLDQLNIFSRNGSKRRQAIFEQRIDGLDQHPESAFTLFADHSLYPAGICAHANGNPRRPDSVAAAVLAPRAGRLWVCQGHPCTATPLRFDLTGATAQEAA